LVAGITLLVVAEVLWWGFWGLVILTLPDLSSSFGPSQSVQRTPTIVEALLAPTTVEALVALTALGAAHLIVLGVLLVRGGMAGRLPLVGLQGIDLLVIAYVATPSDSNSGLSDSLVIWAYGLVPVVVVALTWMLYRTHRAGR
jgi:hypothetical protein